MRAPTSRGFVLVGVVMFVLALTILGLSLFALSGYEGEFLADTHSEEQALFRAEGGMALAQALLSVPPYQLTQSHAAEDTESVVRATAWQDRGGSLDSTGTLDWSKDVFLRVTTQVGSQSRVVEQRFSPQQHYSPYKRLFTARAIHYTEFDASHHSRAGSTDLSGTREAIWQWVQAASDTAWIDDGNVRWYSGRPMLTVEAPTPNLTDYFAAFYATSDSADYRDNTRNLHELRFDAGSDAATRFLHSPSKSASALLADPARHYDFYCTKSIDIEVRGTCVWMAPTGIRFDNFVTFQRAPGAHQAPTLVIVTGPNSQHIDGYGDYRDVGLWFFDGGVRVEDDVRLILVSSGGVRVEMANSNGGGGGYDDIRMPHLNIFADHLRMMGPRPHYGEMDLGYTSSMDALMDDLVSRGVLPTATGQAAGGFTPVAGTWRLP